ncbi:MAG: hypothetical protein RL095_1652 [Verrucomicrobiota bacterium]|jgi:hypothetical protein
MKLLRGKCPGCGVACDETPGEIDRQVNCLSCGRLLEIPALASSPEPPSRPAEKSAPAPASIDLVFWLSCAVLLLVQLFPRLFDLLIFIAFAGFALAVRQSTEKPAPAPPPSLWASTLDRWRLYPGEILGLLPVLVAVLTHSFDARGSIQAFASVLALALVFVLSLASRHHYELNHASRITVPFLHFDSLRAPWNFQPPPAPPPEEEAPAPRPKRVESLGQYAKEADERFESWLIEETRRHGR